MRKIEIGGEYERVEIFTAVDEAEELAELEWEWSDLPTQKTELFWGEPTRKVITAEADAAALDALAKQNDRE